MRECGDKKPKREQNKGREHRRNAEQQKLLIVRRLRNIQCDHVKSAEDHDHREDVDHGNDDLVDDYPAPGDRKRSQVFDRLLALLLQHDVRPEKTAVNADDQVEKDKSLRLQPSVGGIKPCKIHVERFQKFRRESLQHLVHLVAFALADD